MLIAFGNEHLKTYFCVQSGFFLPDRTFLHGHRQISGMDHIAPISRGNFCNLWISGKLQLWSRVNVDMGKCQKPEWKSRHLAQNFLIHLYILKYIFKRSYSTTCKLPYFTNIHWLQPPPPHTFLAKDWLNHSFGLQIHTEKAISLSCLNWDGPG